MTNNILVPDFGGLTLKIPNNPKIINQHMPKLFTLLREQKFKQSMTIMSEVVDTIGEDEQISGICFISAGFIHYGLGRIQQAQNLWMKGIRIVPKAQVFFRVKSALRRQPKNEALLVFMQFLVNAIVNDGYRKVTKEYPIIHPTYGPVEYWDDFVAKRILDKCYKDPFKWVVDIRNDRDDPQNRFLSNASVNTIDLDDLRALNAFSFKYKREQEFTTAISISQSIIALCPEYNVGYFNLAKQRYLNGNIELALIYYMRCLHLEANFAMLRKPEQKQLENSLTKYPLQYIQDIQKVNQNGIYLFYDDNTLKHLGHTIIRWANLPIDSSVLTGKDYSYRNKDEYLEYYDSMLRGDGNAVPLEIANYCIHLAVFFALENLEWDKIASVDVYYSYTDLNKFTFSFIGI